MRYHAPAVGWPERRGVIEYTAVIRRKTCFFVSYLNTHITSFVSSTPPHWRSNAIESCSLL